MKKIQPKPAALYAALAAAVTAVSASAVMVKLALQQGMGPLAIAFFRLAAAAVIMLPAMLLMKQNRAYIRRMKPRQWLLLVVSGVFLALHFITWMMSLERTSTFSSVVLVCLEPFFVLLGGFILFKEKFAVKSLFGAGLALAGAVIIGLVGMQQSRGSSLSGDLLALSSAVFVAGYVLTTREARREMPLMVYASLTYTVCTVILGGVMLLTRTPFTGYSGGAFLQCLLLGIVCTVIGHTLFNWCLGHTKSAMVSITILGEPIGAAVWAWFLLGELPVSGVLFGGAVVLAGVFLFVWLDRRGGKKTETADK